MVATTKGWEAQKRLSEWIIDHGIKQAAIARALGIRKHRICDIVNMKSEIKTSELVLICAFIDKSPSDFLENEKEE